MRLCICSWGFQDPRKGGQYHNCVLFVDDITKAICVKIKAEISLIVTGYTCYMTCLLQPYFSMIIEFQEMTSTFKHGALHIVM